MSILSEPFCENLQGTVERVTFHNPDSGFCVLQVRVAEHSDTVSIVGKAAQVRAGESIRAEGAWQVDKTYGRQFKAERLQLSVPTQGANVEKYLASGVVKGVGKHYAKLLVKTFGDEVFDVLEHNPERLREVNGLGKKRSKQILSGWNEQKSGRDVMFFLQTHGIGAERAAKIRKFYGEKAIEKIKANPYCLAQDISGIGFKTADAIAQSLEIPLDSPLRARAGIQYVLQECRDEGHCAMPKNVLIENAVKLLEIPAEIIDEAIDAEISAKKLIVESTDDELLIFLKSLHQAEISIAQDLQRLQRTAPVWHELDDEISEIELSASQRAALTQALQAKVFIITGGPGVGKTTVVKSLLKLLKANKLQIDLCAPTGRAAKRLTETTGLVAKTIHRLLEFDPMSRRFKKNAEEPLATDLVIVDEASMIDVELMRDLLRAIPDQAGLFLIGDVDQLPSVGPGAVLSDIIASKKVPTAFLTEIFRQATSSHIVLNAHRINQGEMLLTADKNQLNDFYFINSDSPSSIGNTVVELVSERIPQRFGFDPLRDIQVLSPMNRGPVGSRVLNAALQKKLNGDAEPQLQYFDWVFTPGDKVIQMVNNYDKDVFNGDIGQIVAIDVENGTVTVDYYGRDVKYERNQLQEIALAYAMSIHKSQGSEYPAVVIVLAMQHSRMLVRNLLYTAVTRGKKLVVIVGQAQALAQAIKTQQAGSRITRLAARLGSVYNSTEPGASATGVIKCTSR